MKKECEIVRDLLPNYVENLVGTQTKDFIKDHLKTCSECTKILKNMEGKDDINYDNDIKEEEVEIRQIKKFRKKGLSNEDFLRYIKQVSDNKAKLK